MRTLKLYTDCTTLDFGKYNGNSIEYVLETNPLYIKWCVENIKWFVFDEELLKEALKANCRLNIIVNDSDNNVKLEDPTLITLEINDNKLKKYRSLQDSFDETDSDDDFHDDWINDMPDNWLSYAAGTDDPETMNDVYWNLD